RDCVLKSVSVACWRASMNGPDSTTMSECDRLKLSRPRSDGYFRGAHAAFPKASRVISTPRGPEGGGMSVNRLPNLPAIPTPAAIATLAQDAPLWWLSLEGQGELDLRSPDGEITHLARTGARIEWIAPNGL